MSPRFLINHRVKVKVNAEFVQYSARVRTVWFGKVLAYTILTLRDLHKGVAWLMIALCVCDCASIACLHLISYSSAIHESDSEIILI